MADRSCDFCGEPVIWTAEHERLDLSLRLMGSGLGLCCDACGDKQIEIFKREYAEEEARIAADVEDD